MLNSRHQSCNSVFRKIKDLGLLRALTFAKILLKEYSDTNHEAKDLRKMSETEMMFIAIKFSS
jgi:hypothetical protein